MKLTIGKRISAAFIISLLALGFLAGLSSYNSKRFLENSAIIVRQSSVLLQAEQVKTVLVDLETGQRGFVITNDSSFLEPYVRALNSIDAKIEDLVAMLDSTPKNEERIKKLHGLISRKNEFASNAIAARRVNFEESQRVVRTRVGKEVMDEIRLIISNIQADADAAVHFHRTSREKAMVSFNTLFVMILLACVVLLGMSFFTLNYNLGMRIKSEQRIHQLNTELEAFSYSVSHDLRSPLRVIDGYAGILKEDYYDKFDSDGKKVIEVIIGNVRRMGQLIDDLLDFSHMNRKPITRSQLDFSSLVQRIVDDCRSRFNNVNLEVTIKSLEPAVGDIKMMEQVWINLISNAVKYSSKKPNPKVEIGSFRKSGDVCFYVKDNGVGFDMEFKDKLFGVFQRLHRMEEFPGTGVGLAIVKRIITRHGGNVWASARVNEGATFYFSLPD